MTRKPRKGDHLRYTGLYAHAGILPYPAGTAVGFRDYGEKVIVRLDATEELYADWPADQVELV
jgi:hypothetical protein